MSSLRRRIRRLLLNCSLAFGDLEETEWSSLARICRYLLGGAENTDSGPRGGQRTIVVRGSWEHKTQTFRADNEPLELVNVFYNVAIA